MTETEFQFKKARNWCRKGGKLNTGKGEGGRTVEPKEYHQHE